MGILVKFFLEYQAAGFLAAGSVGENSPSHEIINDRKSPKTNMELQHESLEDNAPLQKMIFGRFVGSMFFFLGCLSFHSRYLGEETVGGCLFPFKLSN